MFARARKFVADKKNVSDFAQKHFVSATNVSQFAQHGNTTSILCPAPLRGALLNTGTKLHGTEYTGTRRNETEWTRMVPEYTATSRNNGGMDKNGTGIYRNELE